MGEAKRRAMARLAGNGDTRSRPVQVTPYLTVPDIMVKPFRNLFLELVDDADRLQPSYVGEFNQRAAALHEASHCVVSVREGYPLKTAAISRQYGHWLGEFWLDVERLEGDREILLAHLRITLAGRRGELLFTDPFSLRAGLDELAYALLMVIIPLTEAAHARGCKEWPAEEYEALWGTLLAETDETLMAHEDIVHAIADRLMLQGRLDGAALAALTAAVPKRVIPPPVRSLSELRARGIAHDPLAHGKPS
jgi:hypothetical protein